MIRAVLIIRFVLFLIFFLAGAGAIVLAILARPELEDYFKNRAMLEQIEAQNETLKSLTDQYAAQVALIESEPNILQRFSVTTFGHKPSAPDTVFPEADNADLRAEADKILKAEPQPQPVDPVPAWLARILEPKIRKALFATGCGLILITFIFFGTTRTKSEPT